MGNMELKPGMHTQNCLYGVTDGRISDLEKKVERVYRILNTGFFEGYMDYLDKQMEKSDEKNG